MLQISKFDINLFPNQDFQLFFRHGFPFAAKVTYNAFLNINLKCVQIFDHVVIFNVKRFQYFWVGFEFSGLHFATEFSDFLGAQG